jgi:glycosyltransferase involved in cell wall biosynthesis
MSNSLASKSDSVRRIVLILDGFKQGGVQQYYLLLINEYCKKFDKVTLVILEQTEFDLNINPKQNLEIVRLCSKSLLDLKSLITIHRLFKAIKPNVIIASMYKSQIWSALIRLQNSKLIWIENNIYHNRTHAQWILMKLMAKKVHKIVCISESVKTITDKRICVKSEVIYCPVNFPENLKIKRPCTDDFIFIGRLIEQKNPKLLLESFEIYCKKYNMDSIMHLVGGGSLMPELISLAQKLGISHKCRFYSDLDGIEKWELLLKSKTLVSTSRFEGFGLVRFEALAHGRCLVTTNTGGSELLTNKQHLGVFIVSASPRDIAEAMHKSINESNWNLQKISDRLKIVEKCNPKNVSELLLS